MSKLLTTHSLFPPTPPLNPVMRINFQGNLLSCHGSVGYNEVILGERQVILKVKQRKRSKYVKPIHP